MSEQPPLEVAIVLPPAPFTLVGGGFITTLLQVEQQIADMKIVSAQDAQSAANITQRLTEAGKKLEAQRVALKAPFLAAERSIDAAAKAPAERIEAAKRKVRVMLVQYDDIQRKLAEEAEEKRLAELDRLEKIRLAEEAENARKAADLLAEAERKAQAAAAEIMSPVEVAEGSLDFSLDDGDPEPGEPPPVEVAAKTETEKAIDLVRHAPVVAPPKLAGVAFRVTLVPSVTDINKVPDIFVVKTLKLQAVLSTFCTKYKDGDPLPVCDGIEFTVKRDAVSTGKAQF